MAPEICEIMPISGHEPRLADPGGFDLIPVNLTPQKTGSKEKPLFPFLCTRSIEPLPETEVITELLVSWGPPPRGYEAVEFPLTGTGGSGSETKTDGEEKKEENRVVCNLCYRKATVEEDLSASDREAEEYRMAEIARERERMAAQRDRIVPLRNELSHL